MPHHILERNISQAIVKKDLEELLNSGKKLRVYLGVDPTGPKIHLGHAIALRKLKEFQDLGHTAILLIGDFTAQIGDPTGKTTMRKPLTRAEIEENFHDFQKQAAKILDFDGKNPAEIRFNSTWLKKLNFVDILRLTGQFTVQQMLERDMFQNRLTEEKPIGLHEFLYPLMQGYDTVALEADIEIGGTDQTFNMLAGRTLRQKLEGKDKHVLTTPILEGTDGRKMSKSYHNDIGISDSPQDQFGKIMSMKDSLIIDYFTLCTSKTDQEISEIKERLNTGENPKNIKTELAKEIVQIYHSKKEAEEAAREFDRIFTQKDLPSEIPKISIPENNILGLHLLNKLLPKESNSQIKRLFKEGAIKHNQEKITSFNEDLTLKEGDVIQVGKRKFFQIKK